jgi:hypothetical protein
LLSWKAMRRPRGRLLDLRRGGVAVVVAGLALGGIAGAACDESGSPVPSVPGDTVINDTRDAEIRAPANPDPGDGATPMGQPEASYDEGDGGYASDAPTASFPGVAECSSCACPATTSYCFGGGTARKAEGRLTPEGTGSDAAADAGPPPCPRVEAGVVGCALLPAGATDCPSLLATLQATYSCYLVCANNGTQITAYCPNP